MNFILRKASTIYDNDTIDINSLDDLKCLQAKYGQKLIINFETDSWPGDNNKHPSIIIYDDWME